MTSLRDWASERPLFTIEDAARAFDLERPSLREKLSRLVRRGELRRIERGKYTVHDDRTIYATHVEIPSYLSLWSGLRYYDRTTQQPTRVQVMAARSRADLDGISFYRTSRMFGFGRRRYNSFEIFVADEERLLLDCLVRPEVSVADLTELLAAVDPEQTVTYAVRYGQQALKKRVGYLLERTHGVTAEALRIDDRNYPVLDLARPDTGETDSRWRLRVNTDAL